MCKLTTSVESHVSVMFCSTNRKLPLIWLHLVLASFNLHHCLHRCLHGYRQQPTDDHAKSPDSKDSRKLFPNGFSHPASQIQTDLPPRYCNNCSNLASAKTRKQQTTVGRWVLRIGRGQLRETGSTPAAPPATSRATNSRQHRPKDLNKP